MSLNAATIELLLSKGLSGDDLLEVARAMEKKVDRTAAERQARHRAKKRTKRNAVTVTRDPPIDRTHTPGSEILPDGKTQNSAGAKYRDLKPDDVSDETWDGFEAARKARRSPITATVVRKICEEADRARWRWEDAFAEISARGWQSFKAEWVQEKSNGTGNRTGGSTADTAQRVRERFGIAG